MSTLSVGSPTSTAARASTDARAAALEIEAKAQEWRRYTALQRWCFFIILFLVITSNYFDYFALPVLLEPIKHEFRVSDAQLGLLSGLCFALWYSLAALPIAHWADNGNRRTVIAVCLAGWSAMTALGGLARSYTQLAVTRFGVGITEPGALPPAQSLVADYFPPERRATAIAFLTMGASAVGSVMGIGLAGQLAETHGWRSALLVAGAPGLVLALIAWCFLAEPRTGQRNIVAHGPKESIGRTIGHLRGKRSFLWSLVGTSLYLTYAYGASVFLPSFMVRTLHASLGQVGMNWAIGVATADGLGGLAGGWVADHLSRRDIRWYAWLPAISCALGLPLYILMLSAQGVTSFIALNFIAEFVVSMGYPIFFVGILTVCGRGRRTMASAIAQCVGILVGSGVGPLLAGALSDRLSARYPNDSLRYALSDLTVFLPLAAVAFFWSARSIRQELED